MATTTNYGWTTPDDTALVKDGAAAIRSLGSAIDTTTKNLNPGTTNGDIDYYATGTTKSRVAIGSSGQCLTVSAGLPSWQPSATSVLTSTGDLLYASAANTLARRAIGSTGDVLTVSGGVPTWATPSSGGLTLISETVANANSSLSLSSIPGTYKQIALFWSGIYHSNTSTYFDLRINNNSGAIYGEIFHFGFNSSSNQTTENIFTTVGVSAFGENLSTSFAIDGNARGYLLIDNYASTTKLKQYRATMIFKDSAGNKVYRDITGIFNSTSAVTSLDVVRTSGTGTFTNGTNTSIRLYGVS